MTELRTGRMERVAIDKVVPYWRNPRRVTDEAVNVLASSLSEYGYQQPIVVDEQYVIIVGHTRYSAMRRLGWTETDVMVVGYLTDLEVKQLRVIDNRSAEFTSWDFEALVAELRDHESDLIAALFPEAGTTHTDLPSTDLRDFTKEWDLVDDKVDFVCPTCFHSWTQQVTRADLVTGRIDGTTQD